MRGIRIVERSRQSENRCNTKKIVSVTRLTVFPQIYQSTESCGRMKRVGKAKMGTKKKKRIELWAYGPLCGEELLQIGWNTNRSRVGKLLNGVNLRHAFFKAVVAINHKGVIQKEHFSRIGQINPGTFSRSVNHILSRIRKQNSAKVLGERERDIYIRVYALEINPLVPDTVIPKFLQLRNVFREERRSFMISLCVSDN